MSIVRKNEIPRHQAALEQWLSKNALAKCLFENSDCSEGIIRAHAVQNSWCLGQIEEQGHVLMFRNDHKTGDATLQSVGRNKATVFTGMCETHDCKVFLEVDFSADRSVEPITRRKQLLLGLRAMAKELWAKMNTTLMYDRIEEYRESDDPLGLSSFLGFSERGASQRAKAIWADSGRFLENTRMAISRIEADFGVLKWSVEREKYHRFCTHYYRLALKSDVACSALINLEFDLNGIRIAHFGDPSSFGDVSLTIIPNGAQSLVSFCYHRRFQETLSTIFEQLDNLPEEDQAVAFSRMLIIHAETYGIRPSWLNDQPESRIAALEKWFEWTGATAQPYSMLPAFSFFS